MLKRFINWLYGPPVEPDPPILLMGPDVAVQALSIMVARHPNCPDRVVLSMTNRFITLVAAIETMKAREIGDDLYTLAYAADELLPIEGRREER